MKKLISLVMCFVLIAGCLSGCVGSSGAKDSSDISENGMKLLISLSRVDDFTNKIIQKAKDVAEKSGAKVELIDEQDSI